MQTNNQKLAPLCGAWCHNKIPCPIPPPSPPAHRRPRPNNRQRRPRKKNQRPQLPVKILCLSRPVSWKLIPISTHFLSPTTLPVPSCLRLLSRGSAIYSENSAPWASGPPDHPSLWRNPSCPISFKAWGTVKLLSPRAKTIINLGHSSHNTVSGSSLLGDHTA